MPVCFLIPDETVECDTQTVRLVLQVPVKAVTNRQDGECLVADRYTPQIRQVT